MRPPGVTKTLSGETRANGLRSTCLGVKPDFFNIGTVDIFAYGDVDTGSNTSYNNVSTGSNDTYSDVATGSNTSYSDAA